MQPSISFSRLAIHFYPGGNFSFTCGMREDAIRYSRLMYKMAAVWKGR